MSPKEKLSYSHHLNLQERMNDFVPEEEILINVVNEEGSEHFDQEYNKGYDDIQRLGDLHSRAIFTNSLTDISEPLFPTSSIVSLEEDYYGQSSHTLLLLDEVDDQDHIKPTSSYGQAVFNGMNTLCGVGILSSVNAVKQGGWLSLTILLIFSMLAFYTGILLRRCVDSGPGIETYPDIGQAAFGVKGKLLISIVMYVELYVTCVELIILESDTLSSLFPNAHLSIAGLQLNSNVIFAIASTLIVLPTAWLRDLSLLSYISAGGVVSTIIVASTLCWVGIVDDVGLKNEGGMLINWSGIPFAIGLYGYFFAGHAVFPNLYCSLKKRSQFPWVLFTSFLFATIMMGGTAIIGYMMFGESTLSEFTLNIPNNLFASKVAVCITLVTPLCKYALTLLPVSLSLEELIPKHMRSLSCSIVIRTALVVSSLFVALTVPFFDLVMAFAGSALGMLMTLIFPCVCFISIARDKLTFIQMSVCILIIALGTVVAVVGTYSSVSKIMHELVH